MTAHRMHVPGLGRLLAVVLATLLLGPATAVAAVPEGAVYSQDYIQGSNPVTDPTLHVDVLRPKDAPPGAKLPIILSVGPYFNHSGSTTLDTGYAAQPPNERFFDMVKGAHIFQRGYAFVMVDLRGFGASEGCNDFGGPGEKIDAKRAVEWAASQPWSNGKVGLWGKSYDAWTEVMALDQKPKGLAAAVVMSPIIDGYRTLYQRGVHYTAGWYATPVLYQSQDAKPPSVFDDPAYFQHWALGLNPACYAQNTAQQDATQDHDDATGFWKARDLPAARGSDVPVLWSHGFMDANTKPDNFLPVYSTLTGPKRAWFGQYHHVRGNEAEQTGHTGFLDEAFRWFDRYVKGDSGAHPERDPPVEVAEGDGRWRAEAQWPPRDAVVRPMEIHPGSYTDDSSNAAEGPTQSGQWSFSPPLPHQGHLAGTFTAQVRAAAAAPRAGMVAMLYDVAPDGSATLIQRGASLVGTGADGLTNVELYPDDWTIDAGHRVGLLIAGDDTGWYLPNHTHQPVTITKGTLSLPWLSYTRSQYLPGAPTPAMGTRSPIQVARALIEANTVATELPPPLVAPPAVGPGGAFQGAKPPPRPLPGVRDQLRVTVRVKARTLLIGVRGVGASKVHLTVTRGRRVVARRTLTGRRDAVRLRIRVLRGGSYRVSARLLGTVRLTGRSRPVRVG